MKKFLRRLIFVMVFIYVLPITWCILCWTAFIEIIITGGICWLLGIDRYLGSKYFNNMGLLGAWFRLLTRILGK